MDEELRVIQARGPKGKVVATYLNYSAHPTVLGSSNLLWALFHTICDVSSQFFGWKELRYGPLALS